LVIRGYSFGVLQVTFGHAVTSTTIHFSLRENELAFAGLAQLVNFAVVLDVQFIPATEQVATGKLAARGSGNGF